jgi:hypothetical protein
MAKKAEPSRVAAALQYLQQMRDRAADFGGGVVDTLSDRARDFGGLAYEAFTSDPNIGRMTTAEYAQAADRPTPRLDQAAQDLGTIGRAIVTDPLGTGKAIVGGEVSRAQEAVTGPRAAGQYVGSFVDPLSLARVLKMRGPRLGLDEIKPPAATQGMSVSEMEKAVDPPYFNLEGLTTQPTRQVEIPRYDPPRGVPSYMQRLTANQKAYDQVLDWARSGMTEEGLGWYNTEALRKEFVKEFGEEVGQKNYERYIDLVAATSAGAKTPSNAKIASYYYVQGIKGEPATKPPKGSGYGHKAQNLHFKNAAEILEGGALDPIANPKRYTFGENLKGNWDYATVDKHNVRAFAIASKDPEFINTRLADPAGTPAPDWWNPKKYGEWKPEEFNPREFTQTKKVKWETIPPTWFKEAPTKTDYKAFEDLNRRLAKDLGISPAAAQAALWLGAGKVTGLGSPPVAFMKILEGRLAETARKRGISREQALKEFIRGNAPLLQMGGLAVGAGMLAPTEEQQQQ